MLNANIENKDFNKILNINISDISEKQLSAQKIQKEAKKNKFDENPQNLDVSSHKFNDNKTNKEIIKKKKEINTKIVVKNISNAKKVK